MFLFETRECLNLKKIHIHRMESAQWRTKRMPWMLFAILGRPGVCKVSQIGRANPSDLRRRNASLWLCLKKYFRLLFQHCCFCGGASYRNSHLCEHCYIDLFQKPQNIWLRSLIKNSMNGFYCLALGSYRCPQLQAWVLALKEGDGPSEDYRRIAREWIRQRHLDSSRDSLKAPIVIIPSPSRIRGAQDHAYRLSKALADETGWNWQNILEFQSFETGSQKKKGIHQRTQRVFQQKKVWIEEKGEKTIENSMTFHNGTIIFVDDVVTTGSTALAARDALHHPPFFEVWCMALQPKKSGL